MLRISSFMLAGVLAVSLVAQAEVEVTFNEFTQDVAPGYPTTIDVVVDVPGLTNWDWLNAALRVELTEGTLYYDSYGNRRTPNPMFIGMVPSLAYDTHAGGPDAFPAAVSPAGSETWDPQSIAIDSFDSDAPQTPDSQFTLLRVTVSPDAKGTIYVDKFGYEDLDNGGGAQFHYDESYPIGITAEIAAAAGGPYEEGDWPEMPPGWNNPARTIALDGTGSTGTIDAYEWSIAPPVSGDFMPLAATGATPDVSIQAIADALGIAVDDLPGPYGAGVPDPDVYNYRLMLTVSGGGASDSDETTLFVPEPGTVVLLGLGGLAALIRRRRS